MSWLDADEGWRPVQVRVPTQETDQEWGDLETPEGEEQLPEYIYGKKVSNIEARFFIAASEHPSVDYVETQVSYVSGRNLPGEIRLDFLLHSGGIKFPVFTDGLYWHKDPAQKAKDAYQEDRIDEILQGAFCFPVQRVPDTDLETIEDAAVAIDGVLSGKYIMKR